MGPLAEPAGKGEVTQTLDLPVMILSNGCLNKLSYDIRMVVALGVAPSSSEWLPAPNSRSLDLPRRRCRHMWERTRGYLVQ